MIILKPLKKKNENNKDQGIGHTHNYQFFNFKKELNCLAMWCDVMH